MNCSHAGARADRDSRRADHRAVRLRGGFVTVPVIVWADGALGAAAPAVAVATSAVVMVVNAAAATAATSRATLAHLRSAVPLVALLACGGALAQAWPGWRHRS